MLKSAQLSMTVIRKLPKRCLRRIVRYYDAMADALMKYETIDTDQIDDLMDGKTPREPKGWSDNGSQVRRISSGANDLWG